jgi:HAE1 family hydrophobic/amphiphilic exporter-1
VGLAVVSTTLAVCAVFVPIAFMQSTVGRYFYEFGVAVTVAVCISTLVALTLTPMLASRLLRRKVNPGPLFRTLERGLQGLERFYRGILGFAIRRRAITLAAGLAAVLGGCGVASTLPFDLYTREDLSEASVRGKLPVGTPLTVTERVLQRMEAAIQNHPEVEHVFAVAGRQTSHEPNRLRMDVLLIPKALRDRPITLTFEELRRAIHQLAPDVEDLSVSYPQYGGDGESEYSSLSYSLQGPDLGRLERHANALLERMRDDPDIVDVRSSFETGRPQITLDVDRGRAADLGVSANDIGTTLRTLLAGQKVGSYEDEGRRHDVRVQVLPEYRDDPRRLDLIRLRSSGGELVPLTNAARLRVEEGPVEIRRENRTREIRISANMAAGATLGEGAMRLEAWGRELGIDAPDALVPGGGARTMQEMADDITFAFALALAALYMILASLFNSLTHPFTIMTSAPLAFIGGFVALKLSGMSLDMMSGIGLLVLLGLVMKNGILLVDYINQLRSRGLPLEEAILEAGPVRMRPVLMTSGALIFGLMPTVLSQGVGVEFRAPMAMITIGGLVTSTALTLVVVPVFYSVIDQATGLLLRWSRRLLPSRRTRTGATGSARAGS